MRSLLLGSLVVLLAGCGGGGGGGSSGNGANTQPLQVGALDGKWSCVETSDQGISVSGAQPTTIQIAGTQYYSYAGAAAQTLSFNQGIILGPDKVAYGGYGGLASEILNNRQYLVVHLASKNGYAGIYLSQDLPVGDGMEFSLNGDGTLKISSYFVPISISSGTSGSDANQAPSISICSRE